MDIKLPKLGEGSESGVVVSVLVKEGDTVTKGQTVVELENEKAVAPIPAGASGTVRQIRVKEGDKVSVGQVLLSLDEPGEASQSTPAHGGSVAATTAPVPVPASKPASTAIPEPLLDSGVINPNLQRGASLGDATGRWP